VEDEMSEFKYFRIQKLLQRRSFLVQDIKLY